MISDSLGVEKQKDNEATKGAHARFEAVTLKSLQKLFFSPARLILHLECDQNENKKFLLRRI